MTTGTMAVDWEERVDYSAMRDYRLARAKQEMEKAELAALVCFDPSNLRYVTSTYIGTWAMDKMGRYCVLPNGGEPYLYDFGSAAKVKKMYSTWLSHDHIKPTTNWMRGAVPPQSGAVEQFAKELKGTLSDHGVTGPVGFDLMDVPMIKAVEREGIEIADGQEVLLEARAVKSPDEIKLLEIAASMADGAFYLLQEEIRPGVRESDLVALASDYLLRAGSEFVSCINVSSGPRTYPHQSPSTDRIMRPGELVYIDIMHIYNGYYTCYFRTFVCGDKTTDQQRSVYRRTVEWMDAGIEAVKPGATNADVAAAWPAVQDLGFGDFKDEAEAFLLQFGHGVGLALWERPVFSRLFLDTPYEIKEGMSFALETYCSSPDGKDGARIEDQVIVTEDGARVIFGFPRDELINCW